MNELASKPAKRLTSILISPDQDLSQQIGAALQGLDEFSIGAHLAQYPSSRELTESVRRMQPDVVLIDVSSARDAGLRLIAQVVDYWPSISAVGISHGNEPESILQCLRSGAHEFLSSPFSQNDVHQAAQRVLRRKTVEAPAPPPKQGRLLTFASVKGGAGGTLIAANAACQIQRATKGRVLLIDCNLVAGLISFLFRINHSYSLTDALKHSSQLDSTLWAALVTSRNGIDILTSPEQPELTPIEPYAVQEMLEFARSAYDHVVADPKRPVGWCLPGGIAFGEWHPPGMWQRYAFPVSDAPLDSGVARDRLQPRAASGAGQPHRETVRPEHRRYAKNLPRAGSHDIPG